MSKQPRFPRIKRLIIEWQWPYGRMSWFFWNQKGMYRIGPLTIWGERN